MSASQTPLELVNWAFAGTLEPGTTVDMAATLLEDTPVTERLAAVIADDAEVVFATPDGGLMGDMAGPFRGAAGMRAGWAEWLEPWESFTFSPTEVLETPGGDVLLLGEARGRLAGSGLEVDTAAGALYVVEGERIVRIEHFLDQAQARAAAGL